MPEKRTADVQSPLYNCALTFEAAGGGFQLLIGYFKLKGQGTLRCADVTGNTQDFPVRVRLGGSPLAARLAVVPYMRIQGVSTGIGLAGAPQTLFGHYAVANASAALIVGGTANLALHGTRSALTLNVGVGVTEGLGAEIGLSDFEIEAL